MATHDRCRWNEKYARGEHTSPQPSRIITAAEGNLPIGGRALDVAGGAGRHALWLAERGLDVTLADISDEALTAASSRAASLGRQIHCRQIDLEEDPFPAGPWDLVLCVHYLWRPLIPQMCASLRPGGRLCYLQPTVTNLERHSKPSAKYLLADQELPTLIRDLDIVHYAEGWLADGRHEAFLIAKRAG